MAFAAMLSVAVDSKVAEAATVLSVPGMNVWCACIQASLNECKLPLWMPSAANLSVTRGSAGRLHPNPTTS